MTCAPSEDSDQPGPPFSDNVTLIKLMVCLNTFFIEFVLFAINMMSPRSHQRDLLKDLRHLEVISDTGEEKHMTRVLHK